MRAYSKAAVKCLCREDRPTNRTFGGLLDNSIRVITLLVVESENDL
jgi:hypothetical protein